MGRLSRITLFPIKSMDGIAVPEAELLENGALRYDREYAVVDAEGRFVNGKRTAEINRLRTRYDLELGTVALRVEGLDDTEEVFHLDGQRAALGEWLSAFFGRPVSLQRNTSGGFPDDGRYPGPTLISTATIETVASWFPGIAPDNMRRRLRANLEVSDTVPFWEDHLYAEAEVAVPFRIGEVGLEGGNPCKRCVVPSRDPVTGHIYAGFQRTFAQRRRETLPPWAERSRFDHTYRLSVNTRVPFGQAGRRLRVGDPVKGPGL